MPNNGDCLCDRVVLVGDDTRGPRSKSGQNTKKGRVENFGTMLQTRDLVILYYMMPGRDFPWGRTVMHVTR